MATRDKICQDSSICCLFFAEMGLIPAGMPQYYGVAPWNMYPANLIPQQSSQPPPRRPLTPSQQAGENQPPYQVCMIFKTIQIFFSWSHGLAFRLFVRTQIFSTNCIKILCLFDTIDIDSIFNILSVYWAFIHSEQNEFSILFNHMPFCINEM